PRVPGRPGPPARQGQARGRRPRAAVPTRSAAQAPRRSALQPSEPPGEPPDDPAIPMPTNYDANGREMSSVRDAKLAAGARSPRAVGEASPHGEGSPFFLGQ